MKDNYKIAMGLICLLSSIISIHFSFKILESSLDWMTQTVGSLSLICSIVAGFVGAFLLTWNPKGESDEA